MNRRCFLGTAVAASALAGCLSSSEDGSDGVFAEIETTGLNLDIEFSDDSDIREANLVQDGELVDQTTLEAGEYRTSIPLFDRSAAQTHERYRQGEFTLIATDDSGEKHEHELTLEPESEIIDVEIPDDNPNRIKLEIENTGNGPGAVIDMKVTGEELEQPFDSEDAPRHRQLLEYPDEDNEAVVEIPLPAGKSVEIMPAEDFMGFPTVTGYEPNADPDYYDGVEELEEAWAGETTEVEVVVQTATYELLADVELLFDGDIVSQHGLTNHHNFTETEVIDFETSTEDL